MHGIQPIVQLARTLGIGGEQVTTYGKYKAKISLPFIDDTKINASKLILVTSITPTKAGNGKTTSSIGLADGLHRIGKRVMLALREPSLGPCFGMKGGATGAGRSQLVPAEEINLHFTGDFHAISAANNMLAALLDNYNYHNQGSAAEMKDIYWRRVMDVNDRSLRFIITGLNGGKNGLPTETGFDITPASELMAVLCLSKTMEEMHERVDSLLLGYRADDTPFTAKDLKASGSVMALLRDAFLPNLVQTLEGTPALVHGGPFANIAHGCNSLIATRTALQLSDYVLTEAGFGSDLGAEKFFNIKCRTGGLNPALSVLVVTTPSIKLHGGVKASDIKKPDVASILKGMKNVAKHIGILQSFGQKVLVVLNRFDTDTNEEVKVINEWCAERNIAFALNNAYAMGSEGSEDAANMIVAMTEEKPAPLKFTYELEDSIEEKLRKVVTGIYGGKDIVLEKKARQHLKRINQLGLGNLPICIAKTQYSFTDVPEQISVYDDFIIPVDDLIVNTGSRFIVAVCGEMMRMPGLPETPSANNIDVVNGKIVGLS